RARFEALCGSGDELEPGVGRGDGILTRRVAAVDHLDAKRVADAPVVGDAERLSQRAQHGDVHRALAAQVEGEEAEDDEDADRVEEHARPGPPALRPGLRLRGLLAACLGGVADEAELAAELGHDGVAGVDALGAVDALHLEAVADVDAHGADLDAHAAVDAVAGVLIPLALLAARLAAV